MIKVEDYFRDSREHFGFVPSDNDLANAVDLLERVEALEADFVEDGGQVFSMTSGHRCRAKTLDLIKKGYRAAVGGKHESANAVDVADPLNELDAWLDDDKLASYGLYREAPEATKGWVHLQNIPPGSHRRTFNP